jgi:RNase P/RNase MRP subunit p30
MYCDIVFPNKNEKEFIAMASLLGYSDLCFAYEKEKNLSNLQAKTKVNLHSAIITDAKNVKKAKKLADVVIVKAANNRHIIEKAKPDIIFGLEESPAKDFIHHRNSGLNHVLCELARINKVMVGFSFNFILKTKGMLRSQIIGRMSQNIRLCRKYKVTTAISSFATNPYEMRSPHDLIAFGITLGMHPSEAKKSLKSVVERIRT